MLAHYHGQLRNSSELTRSFGVSHKTVQHYLDVLTETFMVRQLLPWHENIGKRQVKAPKIYVRDKRTSSPTPTRSMHTALGDLRLNRLFLVHAGRHTFDLKPAMRALAFGRILEDFEPLR